MPDCSDPRARTPLFPAFPASTPTDKPPTPAPPLQKTTGEKCRLKAAGEEAGWTAPASLSESQIRAKLIEFFQAGVLVLLRLKSGSGNSESGGSAANNDIDSKPGAQDAKGGPGKDSGAGKSGGTSSGGAGSGAGAGTGASGGTSKDAPPADPKTLTWVRFALVDEDGNPLDDELYEITLSDGKSVKGKWPKGQAEMYFDLIPDGQCRVRFPKLKDNGWKPPK